MTAPRFVARETGGGREWMLAHGPSDGPQVLLLQPLFEEMNRCRAVLSTVQRVLAEAGIGSWLGDLPGTGESLRAIEAVSFADWRRAVADMARVSGATAIASFRGGCLLDDAVELPRWRLSPIAGAAALRDLARTTGAARATAWELPPALAGPLGDAIPVGTARIMRLASDPAPADARIEGAPPWRRAEPSGDAPLAHAVAADIAAWLKR